MLYKIKIIFFLLFSHSMLMPSIGSNDSPTLSVVRSPIEEAFFLFPTIKRDPVFERLHEEFKKMREECEKAFFGEAIQMIEKYRITESGYNERLESKDISFCQKKDLTLERNTALIEIAMSIMKFKIDHYSKLSKEIEPELMSFLDALSISNPEIPKLEYYRYGYPAITFKEILDLIREDKLNGQNLSFLISIIETNIGHFSNDVRFVIDLMKECRPILSLKEYLESNLSRIQNEYEFLLSRHDHIDLRMDLCIYPDFEKLYRRSEYKYSCDNKNKLNIWARSNDEFFKLSENFPSLPDIKHALESWFESNNIFSNPKELSALEACSRGIRDAVYKTTKFLEEVKEEEVKEEDYKYF